MGEAKALARLRHPRIVPVYEAGCAGDRHYIAMALIEGHSLAEQLAKVPLALRRARRSLPNWLRRWPTPKVKGSSTATSSQQTSGSTTKAPFT